MPTTTATATAGTARQNRLRARMTTMPVSLTARAARFTRPVGHALAEVPGLGEQPPSLDREPAQPGKLADQDGDGDAAQVAELHRARQQLGHEPQPGHAGDQDDQAGEDGQGPGQGDRRLGVVAAKGRITAASDESGPRTITRDGPNTA
jgi:hypothetical protein